LDFTIPKPIEQIINGRDGIYELIYLQKESRSFSRYKKLVEVFDKNFDEEKLIDYEKKVMFFFTFFS